MPALTNPRHERFAQELAKGKRAIEAHEQAGYRPDKGSASKLQHDPKISQRVAEIQSTAFKTASRAAEKAAERLSVTVESLIAEADEARLLAMEIGQPAAAIAAVKEKGVLAGIRVEKSERKNLTDVRRLDDSELDAAIADALAREQAEAERPSVTH